MNCYCCGKPLKTDNGTHWHRSCIRKFFGTNVIPEIDISNTMLESLAERSVKSGYTVPGVQKKLSLHLLSDKNAPRLTLVDYPTGYILKPQVPQFEALPEAEHLVMCMAEASGISTVPHALVGDSVLAYVTKRIDRIFESDGIRRLSMEDFCQLDLRLTEDKYRGSYERCARVIRRYSAQPALDMTELYLRLVFCFVVGNSDMHLKNFSLIEKKEGSLCYVLSPSYDLLPVNIIMPEDQEEFALPMNGKKTHLRKKDFLLFAETAGISSVSAEKLIRKILSMQPKYLEMCENSLLPEHLKRALAELIQKRCKILE